MTSLRNMVVEYDNLHNVSCPVLGNTIVPSFFYWFSQVMFPTVTYWYEM